jgi:transcription elongation GreA/GreB family factor
VRISSLRQFDELAADLPSLRTRRAEVATVLRSHQRHWDDADRAIGYTATRKEEAAASADEERLITMLLRQTPRLCAVSPQSSTC